MEIGGPSETDGLSPSTYGNSKISTSLNLRVFFLFITGIGRPLACCCSMLATTLWVAATVSSSGEESDNEETLR